MYSESSYAASQTTARTTPPPSNRGPYFTKDPDKIIIKAVYSFNNTFMQRPIAQLVSGQGNVTDGLILRITTEGLFIDDDVRGVPQREWDVKAWTMKLAEVWCPRLEATTHSGCFPNQGAAALPFSYFRKQRPSTGSESDALLKRYEILCHWHWDPVVQAEFPQTVVVVPGAFPFSSKTTKPCPPSSSSLSASNSASQSPSPSSHPQTNIVPPNQSAELTDLHVLRASIRDQEGKRYVFILEQTEGWKVAVGLQRLRRGSQARALGVAGLPLNEAKMYLENLGWL